MGSGSEDGWWGIGLGKKGDRDRSGEEGRVGKKWWGVGDGGENGWREKMLRYGLGRSRDECWRMEPWERRVLEGMKGVEGKRGKIEVER